MPTGHERLHRQDSTAAPDRIGSDGDRDVGVVGVGVMGGHLARNLARNGLRVGACDRNVDRAGRLAREHPEAQIAVAAGAADLVRRLARPRRILVLVPAGPAVDEVLDELDPLLEEGDAVIDGGNSRFTDTERRCTRAESRPWSFVGMGISGGAEGALHGPSLMPGGEPRIWPPLRGMLEAMAAQSDTGPCVAWCGRRSAGHFVKMVHNGIEYAEMQHLADAIVLLRSLGYEPGEIADFLSVWNHGDLESFLVEMTAAILRTPDPERPGSALVDAILDRAGQKGTGRWAVHAALDLGVAVPSITAAVDARILSSRLDLRGRVDRVFEGTGRETVSGLFVDDVRDALVAARIAAYTQGFALIDHGSRAHDYGTDLVEIARIWKAGCIIRARLLEDSRRALASDPVPLLVLADAFSERLVEALPAWRRTVAAAATAGLATPGLAASLAWFETLSTRRGSAYLIQAQRDFFGAHEYERTDRPGVFVHTEWPPIGRRAKTARGRPEACGTRAGSGRGSA